MTIQRHKKCVAKALKAFNESREAITVETVREAVVEQTRNTTVATAVTVESVVARLFDVLMLLLDACDEDLRDPDRPEKYTLSPRAVEMRIIWEELENGGADEKPRWVKKAGTLQQALDRAFVAGDRRLVRDAPITHHDRAKLLLEVRDRLSNQAEFLAKLEGRFLPVEKELGEGKTVQLSVIIAILQQAGALDVGDRHSLQANRLPEARGEYRPLAYNP
jgi:hypothetical protein